MNLELARYPEDDVADLAITIYIGQSAVTVSLAESDIRAASSYLLR